MPNVINNLDNQIRVIRSDFLFNTAGIGTGVQIGTVPINSLIVGARCIIITPFNAGTSNLLNVGISAGGAEFLINGALGSAAGTILQQAERWAAVAFDTGRNIFIRYTQSGAAATAGRALVLLEYIDVQSATAL